MRTRMLLAVMTLVVCSSLLLAHDLFIKLDSYFVSPNSEVRIPILNAAAGSQDALRDFALQHHRPIEQFAAQVEQLAQQRSCDRVGKVRHDSQARSQPRHQLWPVETESIGVNQLDVVWKQGLALERAHYSSVEFDRDHSLGA